MAAVSAPLGQTDSTGTVAAHMEGTVGGPGHLGAKGRVLNGIGLTGLLSEIIFSL